MGDSNHPVRLNQDTLHYIDFSFNVAVRIVISTTAWLLVYGVRLLAHVISGQLANAALLPEPTAAMIEACSTAVMAVGAVLMSIIGILDTVDLFIGEVKTKWPFSKQEAR